MGIGRTVRCYFVAKLVALLYWSSIHQWGDVAVVGAGAPPSADWAIPRVLELLAVEYGLVPDSATCLGGEVDLNVAVASTDGQRVVVKLGQPDTDLVRLEWQHQLMRDLAEQGELPEVPHIIHTRDGREIVLLEYGGARHPVRVQTWVPGRMVSELSRQSSTLLYDWGRVAAQMTRALAGSPTPSQLWTHHWDALRAPEAIEGTRWAIADQAQQGIVDTLVTQFDEHVTAQVHQLPRQVVHQDLNDFNILAASDLDGHYRVSGVLDFGDALHTVRIAELAVAVAYAMLRKADPLNAAAEVVRGYAALVPLNDAELAVLFPTAAARLCVNATTWAARAQENTEYAHARTQHTWPALKRLAALPPSLAEEALREAAGMPTRHRPPAAAARSPRPPELVQAAFTPHGVPVRRRSDSGVPATVSLAAELRSTAGLRLPRAAIVEWRDGDSVVLKHRGDPVCWSRWDRLVTVDLSLGDLLAAGTMLPTVGDQVGVSLFRAADAAARAPRGPVTWSSLSAWRRVGADPGLLWGACFAAPERSDPVAARRRHFARSQRHYYDRPPRLLSSADVWLYDEHGLAYLDVMNNVSHVGHTNPVVVAAAHRQAATLNTNSRFVYDGIAGYAARLAASLPDPLEVVFLVCTGSEANDLALRIARQVTGREDVLVIEGAYHGNTCAVTAISPNRYDGPGGAGRPATTHEVIQPNRFRGPFGRDDPDSGPKYAADVTRALDQLSESERRPAAYIAESLMGTAGVIVHPPGYLSAAFDAVRGAGGLCISDEVQVGFGRVGSHFWGFQTHGVVPDIVTMGKPMGNGYPLGAVVTTRAIADAFDSGMKYFNTYGGNPVACAVGTAVLDQIEERALQENAAQVGGHLMRRLVTLAQRHPVIGDVRGVGLYAGIEFVTDPDTRHPAGRVARYVAERMKDEGVLTYSTGTFDNVLKIKPPMTFGRDHAELFVEVLDHVLSGDW